MGRALGWADEVRELTTDGRTVTRARCQLPGSRLPGWRLAGIGAAMALAVGPMLAGCSSGGSSTTSAESCGDMRTAVNVPVVIQVAKGTVNCAAALRVEQGYASMIKKGDIRGNGGGAPVTVDGWTCQGYTTTQALQTGNTSECHTAKAEVVAVLAVPSSGT
jgi:hypothetical protein